MADPNETFGQYMQEESPQEFDGLERHGARLISVRIVSPTEGDSFSIEGEQAMVRDGDPVGVAAEIAKYLKWPAKGRLGVDDPVLAA